MEKIIRPGKIENGNVFCKITWHDKKLSISGVIGPKANGNSSGGCGQINMEFAHKKPEDNDKRYTHLITPNDFEFAPEWNTDKWFTFLDYWKEYHLNDMQPGCEHQRKENWGKTEITLSNGDKKLSRWVYPKEHIAGHLMKPCPVCGYKYGSQWLTKDVPQEVIDWLFALPTTDIEPAWI
jgi:hypothetical protein